MCLWSHHLSALHVEGAPERCVDFLVLLAGCHGAHGGKMDLCRFPSKGEAVSTPALSPQCPIRPHSQLPQTIPVSYPCLLHPLSLCYKTPIFIKGAMCAAKTLFLSFPYSGSCDSFQPMSRYVPGVGVPYRKQKGKASLRKSLSPFPLLPAWNPCGFSFHPHVQ